MDLNDLLQMGGALIQNNSDDATTNLDVNDIANSLGSLFGGSDGNFDLSSMVSNLASNSDFGDIVGSWISNGENAPISPDAISELLGSDKVAQFASNLGLSQDSAAQALSDALPQVVDKATSADGMFGDLLDQVGGAQGAMNMLGKMFG